MAEREAKKQRLRELGDAHSCVRTIVSHMGKFYRTTEPPPWLDLRAVAGQLLRSNAPAARHAAWRCLRESMTSIEAWMGDHSSWRDAVQAARMPHIGMPSEIKASEFIEGKTASIPKTLMLSLQNLKLDFLLDTHPRSDDLVPDFWKGADLDNPIWRGDYMVISKYSRQMPFDDDLTDLVLSIVCRKGQPEGALQPSQPPRAADNDAGYEFSGDEPEAKKAVTKAAGDNNSGEAAVWKKVQASMSRIADTVNETLVTEQAKLLGKRYRQDSAPVQPDVQPKRHKTVEQAPQPQTIMPTVEDSDDDRSIATPVATACVAKEDDRLRALRVGYKRLKKQGQQLEGRYKSLDESTKKLAKDTEQLTKQHRDLRKDHSTEKQNHQQLEAQTKSLEEKIEQPIIQCAALTDDVRKLEDRGAQIAAKCTAFEDENKILRAQVVSLMARIEALEQAQAQATSKGPVEPDRAAASAPTDGARPAEDARHARSRQHPPDHEGRPHDRASRGPRDDRRGVAAAAVPSLQWQAAGAVKYENIDNAVLNQTPRHYSRAGSRFPRVLEMPSFEPPWDPQHEVASRLRPGHHPRPPHPSTNPDMADTTSSPSRPHQSDAHPTAGAPAEEAPSPVPMPAPAQMPAGPSQTSAAAPAPAPASAPAPAGYPVPAFIDLALAHRLDPSPVAAAPPLPTATVQLLAFLAAVAEREGGAEGGSGRVKAE